MYTMQSDRNFIFCIRYPLQSGWIPNVVSRPDIRSYPKIYLRESEDSRGRRSPVGICVSFHILNNLSRRPAMVFHVFSYPWRKVFNSQERLVLDILLTDFPRGLGPSYIVNTTENVQRLFFK